MKEHRDKRGLRTFEMVPLRCPGCFYEWEALAVLMVGGWLSFDNLCPCCGREAGQKKPTRRPLPDYPNSLLRRALEGLEEGARNKRPLPGTGGVKGLIP